MNPPTETAKDPHELIENAARSFARQILTERQANGVGLETPLFHGTGDVEVATSLAFSRQVNAAEARHLEDGHFDDAELDRDRTERAAAAREASRLALVLYQQHAALRGEGFAKTGLGMMDELRKLGKDANLLIVVERTRQEFAKTTTKR